MKASGADFEKGNAESPSALEVFEPASGASACRSLWTEAKGHSISVMESIS